MNTKQAVKYVLKEYGMSKYRLAKDLGAEPVSVNQWLRNTKMSQFYRDEFFELYGIRIDVDS